MLNTASMAGLVGMQALGIYCASKFAVVGLSESLHRELRGTGIGVSVLCPGIVRTELWNATRNRPDAFGGAGEAPDVAARVMAEGMDPGEIGRRAVDGAWHRMGGCARARRIAATASCSKRTGTTGRGTARST